MQIVQPRGRPHRNQGLFSDHYLNVTLPARPDWSLETSAVDDLMEKIRQNGVPSPSLPGSSHSTASRPD